MEFIKGPVKGNKQVVDVLVNEGIQAREMLVIDDQGQNLGLIKIHQALYEARARELDLVVVSPDSKPVVAKIMDYSKFRYDQQRKQREMKKNQHVVDVKEIRLSPVVDKHDLDTKAKQAIKFIEKGDKVKISLRFKGRMIVHSDQGIKVMEGFIQSLGDTVVVESAVKMEGRQLFATVAPKPTK
ncbi:translation initiation factor IF-3 [Acholeplasma vituli]|uniref:Translation initiation factor IF-3 n=1 Tax=Paracholeplasma vituli TaxID=69473 RepID=A0ABT2PVB8_9MOLU|nr:translation initiation factor IF-3 [Paracholeplasma vituli]MCU0104895.1 translation initiation factor IF-3 [Paracholeplasma vituli]